jgi:hypothetical protein
MRVRAGAVALGVVGLALGTVAVGSLREATLSTHQQVPPGSQIELVVRAETRGGEPGQNLGEMVEAQIQTCRLEVTSDVVGAVEPVGGNGLYRARLTPTMDETNRRQFRGCLQDWTVDHLRIHVLSLE